MATYGHYESWTISLLAITVWALAGCASASAPVSAPGDSARHDAFIRSDVAYVLAVDDQPLQEPAYELRLQPGPHQLTIEYPTLLTHYRCTFKLPFEGGQTYEINTRPDQQPINIYQLKDDGLLTLRQNHRLPDQCQTNRSS